MTETVFAPLSTLGDRLATLGTKRVLVLASSARHLAAARAALAPFEVTVFDGARVHVPIETVEAATAMLATCKADTLVAVGGGSPIGLGKALRLTHDVRFVAVPTTYAGSERTQMYGITRAGDKQTGRDARVRPELVLYDVALTLDMPVAISVQSLLNALAHVVSVLSTDSLAPELRAEALVAAGLVVHAIEAVVRAPADCGPREAAQRSASTCAALYDRGKPGAQHALAHLLGGAFDLQHAALHALLLPHFLAHLDETRPELVAELDRAIGEPVPEPPERPTYRVIPALEPPERPTFPSLAPPLEPHERPTQLDFATAAAEARILAALPPLGARLRKLLVAAGAPVALTALGVKDAALEAVLAAHPELPKQIALDAM